MPTFAGKGTIVFIICRQSSGTLVERRLIEPLDRLVGLSNPDDKNHVAGLAGDSTTSRSLPTSDAHSLHLEDTGPAGLS
jgi:hypothetical protein